MDALETYCIPRLEKDMLFVHCAHLTVSFDTFSTNT